MCVWGYVGVGGERRGIYIYTCTCIFLCAYVWMDGWMHTHLVDSTRLDWTHPLEEELAHLGQLGVDHGHEGGVDVGEAGGGQLRLHHRPHKQAPA